MKRACIFQLRYQNYHRSMQSVRIFLLHYQKAIILQRKALAFSCCAIKIFIVPWRALTFSRCTIKKLSSFHVELSHFPVALLKLFNFSMKSACIFLLRYLKYHCCINMHAYSCCAFKKLSMFHEERSHFPVALSNLSSFHEERSHFLVALPKNYHLSMKSVRIIIIWRASHFPVALSELSLFKRCCRQCYESSIICNSFK